MRFNLSSKQKGVKPLLPLPDLTALQKDSYRYFLDQGMAEVLEDINPIKDYTGRNWELNFSKPRFDKPNCTINEAVTKGLTYDAPWYLTAEVRDTQTSKAKQQEIFMGNIPLMTEQGTFIINGIERVVITQLNKAEGVLFMENVNPGTGEVLAGAKILPKNGAWLEFETARSGIITVKIDRKRKIAATTLLRIFGLKDNDQILEAFKNVDTGEKNYIEKTLNKDPTGSYKEAVLEIYRKIRPGEPLVLENAKSLVESIFFNSRRYSLSKVGRFKMNKRLGLDFPNEKKYWTLQKEDLIKIIATIIELNNGKGSFDDIDHLGNRRVRGVGELLTLQLKVGFLQMERNIKERMSIQPRNEVASPSALISPRPVSARIHSFFASGQLSQFMDQVNPLSALDHLRRLSVTGPGGLSKESASFSVRDAHYSFYGRICPTRTPEGPNIGLTSYLALYAIVNEYGFLEAPYKKIVKDANGKMRVTKEVEYMAAYDEEKYYITDASIATDEKGYILDEHIPLRKGKDFISGPASQASYADVETYQINGASAALIPFLSSDDAQRALMASNHQAQAVPLVKTEAPLVGTGIEYDLAAASGASILAREDGKVKFADAEKIVIKPTKGEEKIYYLRNFDRSNHETCIHQKPVVTEGETVKKGDLLADGTSTKNGELSLGQNLLVAYMSWDGYGYDDSIIISSKLLEQNNLSSILISEHIVQVLETKLGPEEITRDIPNVSEESLRNLDEDGIVVVGSEVKSGDILVGKIAPKGEAELSSEERLLHAIFGEKAREVRDNSLRVSHGERGTVIDVKIITKEDNENLPRGVLKEIRVLLAQNRKIMMGDKLAGRHGNKGVISIIAPKEDMPYLEDGTPIDIILSPASVISRMNIGQLLETHLGMAAKTLGKKYAIPAFGKVTEQDLISELEEANLPTDGKRTLYDGRTGEPFDNKVVVGYQYILKLQHLVEDKAHARSTGPYSLITQQPLGGKAQFGGQRFGEMEVWAMEAHSAAHTLKEMLTIKSDDLVGRTRAYKAILQGQPVPEAEIPESFKLLLRELNGLNLKLEPLGVPQTTSEKEVLETEKQEDKELLEDEIIIKEKKEETLVTDSDS